jgi:hypothetical protein
MKVWVRGLLFILTSSIQVSLADAANLIAPSESPSRCFTSYIYPCTLSTGDRPRALNKRDALWELDTNNLMTFKTETSAHLHQGQMVLRTEGQVVVHTLFADIYIENSKALLDLNEQRLEVYSLAGKGVTVQPKGTAQKIVLMPGFQNWFTSRIQKNIRSEVPQVISLGEYSQRRSPFFMDYHTGFENELKSLAQNIKTAAIVASQVHRELIQRRVATVQKAEKKVEVQQSKKSQYDQKIRQLFLKKISHQDD